MKIRGTERTAPTRLVRTGLALALLPLASGCADRPSAPPPRLALSLSENPIETTRSALDRAERSVEAVVYKFDEPSLLPALTAAVERGVGVRLLLDGEQADGGRADEDGIAALRAAGGEVRLWSAERGKLHAKFTVLDGRRALAGSYNWTRSARRGNVELLIELRDPRSVRELSELFEQLWSRAESPAPE